MSSLVAPSQSDFRLPEFDLSIESLLVPKPTAIPIVHPEFSEFGRLWIPKRRVLRTNGLQRFATPHAPSPSLCLLFQRGTCKARDKCNQIHVAPAFIDFVTAALTKRAVSTCCSLHGALVVGPGQWDAFSSLTEPVVGLRFPDGSMIGVPADRIAPTFFWHRLARERRATLYFPAERLCQLHQHRRCKYGPECRNVHVCRDLWPQIAEHIRGMCPDVGSVPPLFAADAAALEPWPFNPVGVETAVASPAAPLVPSAEQLLTDGCMMEHMGLGPVGPARTHSASTRDPHHMAPTNMHASLFASFPVLFEGLVRGEASSRSTTPDLLPSSPCNFGSELDRSTPTNLSLNSEELRQHFHLVVTDEPVLATSF